MINKITFKNIIKHILKKEFYFRPQRIKGLSFVELGKGRHGGYTVVPELLSDNPIMYSFGIGDAMLFEQQFFDKWGGCIRCYDPTDVSYEYISNYTGISEMSFKKTALMDYDGEVKMFYPANKEYVSGSAVKENVGWQQLTDDYWISDCNRLSTLMKENGDNEIDYLKLCVEGAEYGALKDILKSNISIKQIAVAFAGRNLRSNYNKDRELFRELKEHGYICVPYGDESLITFVYGKLYI